MDLESIWGVVTIAGPVVLLVALAWAVLHNRGSKKEVARTEEATARMYDAQNREDTLRDEA